MTDQRINAMQDIKIKIRDIPKAGLDLHKTVDPADLDLVDDFYKCLTPLEIDAHIERADNAVLAGTRVKGKYAFTCARCLEPLQQERTDELDLFFETTPMTEFVDLGEEIRQEMVMIFSTVFYCREDCKGLCPDCGVNLNLEKCRCTKNNR